MCQYRLLVRQLEPSLWSPRQPRDLYRLPSFHLASKAQAHWGNHVLSNLKSQELSVLCPNLERTETSGLVWKNCPVALFLPHGS